MQRAVIIGAGPAGLAAAYELLAKTDIHPVLLESSPDVGGLSKSIEHQGNRFDLGGHRYFTRSEKVLQWWHTFLPLQCAESLDAAMKKKYGWLAPRNGPDPKNETEVMLLRERLSRIRFLNKYFDYPLSISARTMQGLGLNRMAGIFSSYIMSRLHQIRPEKSLEDFFINRFGRVLYSIFFSDYTEKVWGVPCSRMPPQWGAQRVKGLSVSGAMGHALRSMIPQSESNRRASETSLTGYYFYPKNGSGQLWNTVAARIQEKGGELLCGCRAVGLSSSSDKVTSVTYYDNEKDALKTVPADYVFSSMPVPELITAFGAAAPDEIRTLAQGLCFRDCIVVNLLYDNYDEHAEGRVPDTWIYIQDKKVAAGRVQVWNNWSPYMVSDRKTLWLGVEYYCSRGDRLWSMPDDSLVRMAIDDLHSIDLASGQQVLTSAVYRVPRAYPSYISGYDHFDLIRAFSDRFSNLFCIGRNGMHRYNNIDHSMITAMIAVENLCRGDFSKDRLWSLHTDNEYQEERQ